MLIQTLVTPLHSQISVKVCSIWLHRSFVGYQPTKKSLEVLQKIYITIPDRT